MHTHQIVSRSPAPAVPILAAWFLVAALAGGTGLVREAPPGVVGLAAGVPVLAFAALLAGVPRVREWALGLDPRPLLAGHVLRLVGAVFVALGAAGRLPLAFSEPAGWGDVAVALAAPFVARAVPWSTPLRHRIVWLFSVIGLADLVMAVSIGATLAATRPGSMDPMSALPLSLVPTFLAPVLAMAHLVVLAQLVRWSQGRD